MNPTIEIDSVMKVIKLRHFDDPTEQIKAFKESKNYKGWEIWIIVRKIEIIKL